MQPVRGAAALTSRASWRSRPSDWTIATAAAQTHGPPRLRRRSPSPSRCPTAPRSACRCGATALDATATASSLPGEVVSSPGPRITVPSGTTSLTIVLHNQLPPGTNTSLVIPGQAFAAPPVVVGGRVVSMTPEAAPGGSATYTFTNLKPGTFLYQSGSHQAVQVQMGLYGAVTKDAAAGERLRRRRRTPTRSCCSTARSTSACTRRWPTAPTARRPDRPARSTTTPRCS